jgi:alcohol dehydrogenase class IV
MSNQWWPNTASYSEFLSPSLIVGGRGSSAKVAELVGKQFGISAGTVLVAADDIVLAHGLAEPLLAGLRGAGYDVIVSSGFGSEPSTEVIDAAADEARRSDAKVIVGIGGGSVLDSSKLLALLLHNDGRSADWLGAVDPPNGVAPLLLIPTTCGTGSEATRIAMVTVDGSKRASSCIRYVPAAVVIDPDLVATLPAPVVAATAMDALSHAVESLMSTIHSPMSAHSAYRAIDLIVANVEAAVQGDPDALAECLWGSFMAGQALNAGVVMGHSLAYCLAHERPMPHGVSCALALPYCIAYNQHLEPGLAQSLASTLTQGATTDLHQAAESVMTLIKRLGLATTLDEAQLPAETEAAMAAQCVKEYPRPTNPEPLDEHRIEELFQAMRTGDLDAAFAVTSAGAVR